MKTKKSNARKLSLVAAAVAIVMGSAASAQDDDPQTDEVRSAAEELDRAEERLQSAEETVEQREEELEEAIAEAAESDQPASERSSDAPRWDDSDWDELADEHANLGTFVEALRLTGLDDTLSSGTAYTVFAPIDDAFDEDREELLSEENRDELIELLRAHIVADDVDPERAETLDEALTVDGDTVDISVEDGELRVGDSRVVEPDIERGNLRIYPIDELLEVGRSELALRELDED
ncbi:MAG: fasciclin domain-containing protein [Gammaproteobacteria bacterium]|nr:fasciclin domain-containing protein [Gammaproteobacteria bacterium]